ncbi:MAG: AAA family ATPase [Bacteriovoracaceae bacterium]|nr:AAA family ATPase [Bacteriovoracaceae bacterium]
MEESLFSGVVERITFHNPENGWSVIRVSAMHDPKNIVTVVLHQAEVFAGASMDFYGEWADHPQHGRQFKASKVIEKMPSTNLALEKYLGSGLIKGVGPVIANRIVKQFKEKTLDIFEHKIQDLKKVKGISPKKLVAIKESWEKHKSIREVMIFLQDHNVSPHFAVKIFKAYGANSIKRVLANPYDLARDIFGIGFLSADRIALALKIPKDSDIRIRAAVEHTLQSAREEGHCYLLLNQMVTNTKELIELQDEDYLVTDQLEFMLKEKLIQKRNLTDYTLHQVVEAYYANSLFYDENYVSKRVKELSRQKDDSDEPRIQKWVSLFCEKEKIQLSDEQQDAVVQMAQHSFGILTGGPGCGKTTTTRVLVRLFLAMKKRVLLAAPTGRAAQRMGEVIGLPAKTIHRLLEFAPHLGGFKKREEEPLEGDVIIIDETSMLDVHLTASVLRAVPDHMQVIFIGDADQLPSVGPGQILKDLILSKAVPTFKLTKIFRQAEESLIIKYAHEMNKGQVPQIPSPFEFPEMWKDKTSCLFIDAEEATHEQLQFIQRAKQVIRKLKTSEEKSSKQIVSEKGFVGELSLNEHRELELSKNETQSLPESEAFQIPHKFKHVNWEKLSRADNELDELSAMLKKISPFSALNYGLTAQQTILKLVTETIAKYYSSDMEIQILSPQVRGSLGTQTLNELLQLNLNPPHPHKSQVQIASRLFRLGDRVIQTKNNYDLNVFNGDIGKIVDIDHEEGTLTVAYQDTEVIYPKEDALELQLSYAITIHKSQGSEFPCVIIPIATQHFKMLYRNLIYTGLTRAKTLCIFVGQRRALTMGIHNLSIKERQTALKQILQH